MQPRTRLSPEHRQYILKRHKEGAGLREIGREVGRPAVTVQRTLKAAGIDLGPKKTSNKRSSPETEALVLRLYDEGRTWAEIDEQAGVTGRTVTRILDRNGRECDRKGESAAGKTTAIIALNEAGQSARAIGRTLGHSKTTIRAILADAEAPPARMRGCEYPDYFDVIDTPEKAYWLGFIGADGCIITTPGHPEGARLSVQLAVRDKDHLAKLKEAVGTYTTVTTRLHAGFGKVTGAANLSVNSLRLVRALAALGITPRKSATVEPWDGPADLMPHYWRGLFDGDGSIARKTGDQHQMVLCGSEACVRGFAAWAAGICGTEAKPFYRGGCWRYGVSGRYQVPKLVRALYADAPVSLDRKQETADAILASEQPRRKPGPPRMEFPSEEEREEHFREQRRAIQRRYQDKKRTAAAQSAT